MELLPWNGLTCARVRRTSLWIAVLLPLPSHPGVCIELTVC
jgi:hypothetical protein